MSVGAFFCRFGDIESKVDGPLLDRIDIHLEVPSVPYKDVSGVSDGVF